MIDFLLTAENAEVADRIPACAGTSGKEGEKY